MPENARPRSPLKPLSERLLFASNFLRHPNMLGSIIPSSRFLVDQVLEPIDWGRAAVIVEYGPGIGTFTAKILRRMRSDAQLVAIETNRDFVRLLQRTLPDPRLQVVHDSAAAGAAGSDAARTPGAALHHFRHSTRQHAGSGAHRHRGEEPRGARARRCVSRLPVHCPSPPYAAADLRRRAAQFRATELPAGAAVPMHDARGLKAGVPAERRDRAVAMERDHDRDRKYASGPLSISVALFRHTQDGCTD